MSSRSEVLIRILALLQRKTFIETKNCTLKFLKMALFDCAINEKSLQCWRRTGHLPSFFAPTPGDSTAQESRPPAPGIRHPRQKNANPRGSAGGGGSWAQVELTDALHSFKCRLKLENRLLRLEGSKSLPSFRFTLRIKSQRYSFNSLASMSSGFLCSCFSLRNSLSTFTSLVVLALVFLFCCSII